MTEFAELLAYHLGTAARLAAEAGSLDEELRREATHWLRDASEAARLRLAIRKATRLAEDALELAGTDLERALALESLGDAYHTGYTGDEAYASFVEAVHVRVRGVPDDGRAIAYLAGRACEFPIRWPGSMADQLPGEDEVQGLIDLGLAHLPAGDSEERIRLLALQAGWPFAFPMDGYSEDELTAFEHAGTEAADIAERLELWDLASGALDNAGAGRISQGRYGKAHPLWERRRRLLPNLTSLLEIGDFYAVGAWEQVELGDFEAAAALAREGVAAVGGRMPSTEVHTRSWLATALYLLGRWDDALEQCSALDDLLGDRRDEDLPYFATHGVGTAGLIEHARGDHTSFRRRLDTLGRGGLNGSGRAYPSLIRLLTACGEFDRALDVPRPWNWRVHRTDTLWSELEREAAAGRWDAGRALVPEIREQHRDGPAPILGPAADRFEGRAAATGGNTAAAIDLLHAARDGFAALKVPYQRALTDVDLARALRGGGRATEAGDVLGAAIDTFEELGAVVALEQARELA